MVTKSPKEYFFVKEALKRKCNKRTDKDKLEKIRLWLNEKKIEKNFNRTEVARNAGKTPAWLEGFENKRINSISVETTIALSFSLGEPPADILQIVWGYTYEEALKILSVAKEPAKAIEGRAAYDLYDYASLVKMQQMYLPDESLICVLSTDTFPASQADRAIHSVISNSIKEKKLTYIYMWPNQNCIDDIFNHSKNKKNNEEYRYNTLEIQIERSFYDLRQLVFQGASEKSIIESRFFNLTLMKNVGKTLSSFLGSRETLVFYCVNVEGTFIPDSGARLVRTLKTNPLPQNINKCHIPEVSGWAWLSTSDLNHYRLNLQCVFETAINYVLKYKK